MTNFEKWKDGLTLDEMAELLSNFCGKCPFDNVEECPAAAAENYWGKICKDAVREWGEQEAQDE
jgi:hypothetical protein